MSKLDRALKELGDQIAERDRTRATLDMESLHVAVNRKPGKDPTKTLDRIYKVVYKTIVKEKHRYKKQFACRIIGETPRWYKIILWCSLGFAELKVVPKADVTEK